MRIGAGWQPGTWNIAPFCNGATINSRAEPVNMAVEDPGVPENALSYAYNGGGVSNQKLALLGLFLKSFREGPLRVVLPDFVIFDQVRFNYPRVAVKTVFEDGPLHDFATRHGIEVLDIPPRGDEGGWDYFHCGRDYLPYALLKSELGVDSIPCDFFRSLVPVIRNSRVLQHLAGEVFGRKRVRTVAALRIESDWATHAALRLATTVGEPEDYNPSFRDILGKIKNTLSDLESEIYVVCDEAALPVSKDEIRSVVKADLGIDLCWKSDLVSPDVLQALSILDRSLLDFEMAIAGERFVGLSRSTFSNLVSFEKYARTRSSVTTDYVYNLRGPRLGLRTDNGAFCEPALATAADPHDRRFSFDLAQIYQANAEKHLALKMYRTRAEIGGALTQEVFISLYRAASLQAELRYPATDVIATYLRAADVQPSRAEALHGASRYCRDNRLFQQG